MDLKDFFDKHNKIAVAYSGGADSVYLLYEAVKAGSDVTAYYVKSAFQPHFELEDARRLAAFIGADMKVIEADVLSDENVASNPADRCYYCKQKIMSTICGAAKEDGYGFVCDGTNFSDDIADRPGYRALKELGIRSPLRECGVTKDEIRKASHEAGLDTWNKPAYACLATRIKTGERITAAKLRTTEKAEAMLFDMGFRDFRIRMTGGSALVQVTADQYETALSKEPEIKEALTGLYESVSIDENTR